MQQYETALYHLHYKTYCIGDFKRLLGPTW